DAEPRSDLGDRRPGVDLRTEPRRGALRPARRAADELVGQGFAADVTVGRDDDAMLAAFEPVELDVDTGSGLTRRLGERALEQLALAGAESARAAGELVVAGLPERIDAAPERLQRLPFVFVRARRETYTHRSGGSYTRRPTMESATLAYRLR